MRVPVGPPCFDPEDILDKTRVSPSPFRERVGRGFRARIFIVVFRKEYQGIKPQGSMRMYGSHGMDAAVLKAVIGTAGAGNAKGVLYDN